MKLWDKTEFTPWVGMKINLKTGNLVNKPNRQAIKVELKNEQFNFLDNLKKQI